MAQQLSTNTFTTAKFIVASSAALGTHTTITAALASAALGDTIFIRNGTYSESFQLVSGVNLTAYDGESAGSHVTINGNITTGTGAVTCQLSNLRLTAASGNILTVSSTTASFITLNNCLINAALANGLSYTVAQTTASVTFNNCVGAITTANPIFDTSSTGTLAFNFCIFTNGLGAITPNTASAGTLVLNNTIFANPITTSGTAVLNSDQSVINCSAINTTALTCGGNASTATTSEFYSGSASAISIGGTLALTNCVVSSTNTNAITGAGTLNYTGISFPNTSSTINTSTVAAAGAFNPGIYRSGTQPCFLANLGTTDSNVTGNGTSYTLGSGNALTEIFDQNSNFNTNGTFTAPITGKFNLGSQITVTGTTIATSFSITLVTSNRSYNSVFSRAALAANQSCYIGSDCDMDAADTATVTLVATGEAGNTDDILGGATLGTYFYGNLFA